MKILYYASMLAGELDGPELVPDDIEDSPNKNISRLATSQIPQVLFLFISSI